MPESLFQVGFTVLAVILVAVLLEFIIHLVLGKVLNWKAKYNLTDMAETAWKWHSSHPNGYVNFKLQETRYKQ